MASVDKDREQLESSYQPWACKMAQLPWKTVWQFLIKIHTLLPVTPSVLNPENLLKWNENSAHTKSCMQRFLEALLVIAKNLSTVEKINKREQRNLKCILLTERGQTQKLMIPFIWPPRGDGNDGNRNESVVSRSWWWGEGAQGNVEVREGCRNVLYLDWDGCSATIYIMPKLTELPTEWADFTICELYLN